MAGILQSRAEVETLARLNTRYPTLSLRERMGHPEFRDGLWEIWQVE